MAVFLLSTLSAVGEGIHIYSCFLYDSVVCFNIVGINLCRIVGSYCWYQLMSYCWYQLMLYC